MTTSLPAHLSGLFYLDIVENMEWVVVESFSK